MLLVVRPNRCSDKRLHSHSDNPDQDVAGVNRNAVKCGES